MRPFKRASLVLALSSVAIVAPAMASAHSRPHHPWQGGGYVYVNDNTATANTIAAFHRRRDGSLQPLPGSPFATGGAGTGTGIGSQGSLQTAFGGRYILAVDAGSDQVSVLADPAGMGRSGPCRCNRRLWRKPAGQYRRARPPRLRRQRGRWGENYTGFRLGPTAYCGRSRGRPSPCPTARSRAMSCSMETAPSSSRRESELTDR